MQNLHESSAVYWVAASALTCLFSLFVLVTPFFGAELIWIPLGPAALGAASLWRLLVLRARGTFRW